VVATGGKGCHCRHWAMVRQKLCPFDALPVRRRRGDCSLLSLQCISCYFLVQAAHAVKRSEKQGDTLPLVLILIRCSVNMTYTLSNI
jgi:hypothetical protein